jgi:hypothetical protein
MLQTSIRPLSHSPDVSTRLTSVPKLKMKLQGLYFVDDAEIQEAVTDALKKVQEE